MISFIVAKLFYFYYLLLIIRIFLTWLPNIDWNQQPFYGLRSITDPFLNIFRNVIPPIGMLDISPILAIILLMVLQGIVCGFLQGLGL